MDCNCIFCKIIAHEIPSDFLYEDDDVVVINDVSPQAPDRKSVGRERVF